MQAHSVRCVACVTLETGLNSSCILVTSLTVTSFYCEGMTTDLLNILFRLITSAEDFEAVAKRHGRRSSDSFLRHFVEVSK